VRLVALWGLGVIKVTELQQTCEASPSQWEGRTADDQPVYVRYRWGKLAVHIAEPGDDLWQAVLGNAMFEWDSGDGLDGYIPLERVRALTSGVIEWPVP
jgi:hypothetical protein